MSVRNVLQTAFDEFAGATGFTKKSGTWCRRRNEVIGVIELQKSQYGAQYFVNVALWLLALGEAQCPKEHVCHLRSRLSALLPDEEDRLAALLSLDVPMDEDDRRIAFLEVLNVHLLPLLDTCSTLDGIRSLESSGPLESFLITGPAQRVLVP